jgi:hypothetical protein
MLSTIRICLIASTVLALSGCAPKAQLLVWRPAELNINGLERLAILDFEGEQQSGKIARSALQAQLFDNKYYTLVDQAELARVRPVVGPEGVPDVAAAIEAARTIGVDAILCGQVVSYNVVDDMQTDHHIELGGSSSKNAKSGETSSGVGFGLDSTQTLTREASVSLAVKLIDVRTGELRAARQFAHTFHGQRINGKGELPTRESILTKLLNECSQDAIRMIAPHYVPQEVTLARQFYGKGTGDIRSGNKLAAQGNWSEAVKRWEAAAQENPQSHAAQFNLAVAAEARQDYPAAQQHVDAAIKQYAATDYQRAKSRISRGEQQFQAALAQAQSRATAIAARQAPRMPSATMPPAMQPAYVPPPHVTPASHAQLPSPGAVTH